MKRLLPLLALFALPAEAYVGPGAGISLIGALLGLLSAIGIALVTLFWAPIKRMLKKSSPEEQQPPEGDKPPAEDDRKPDQP